MTQLEKDLNEFRTFYKSIRVNQYEKYLVYSVGVGTARRSVMEANELIESLGLPLVAKFTSNTSFVVEEKE